MISDITIPVKVAERIYYANPKPSWTLLDERKLIGKWTWETPAVILDPLQNIHKRLIKTEINN